MWSHVVLTTLLPLSLASACPSPRVSINVSAIHEPVWVLSDYSLVELRDLAGITGRVLLHRPLRFYYASVANDVSITPMREVGPAYTSTLKLNVILRLTNRNIEIAHDLASISCDEDAVLQHYRSHAASDDIVFGKFAKAIARELNATTWPIDATSVDLLAGDRCTS